MYVPRCARCKKRAHHTIAIATAGGIGGAILLPLLQSLLFPNFVWFEGGEGIIRADAAFGILAGVVTALAGIWIARRRLKLRSVTDYPPVVRLRNAGWGFPSG